MGDSFLGVDLNTSLSTESAPELAPPSGATDNAPTVGLGASEKPDSTQVVDKQSAPAGDKPDLVDLDKLERFRWKGKETTRKEWEDAQLRHSDYTRRVQQVRDEQKKLAESNKKSNEMEDHFVADLPKLVKDRSLLKEMKKYYPASFVRRAEAILSNLGNEAPVEENAMSLPPEVEEKLSTLDELKDWKSGIEAKIQEARQADNLKTIDGWFDKYGKQYSEADPEVVNNWAWSLAEQLEKDGKQIGEKDIEKLFKTHHDRMTKRFEDIYRAKFEAQKTAASKAKDVGAGGGVPSAPPVKARTIDEATALAISDARAGRI